MLLQRIFVDPLFRKILNDPINWVAFIRDNNLDYHEQRYWRDKLLLDHTFDDDFEA